MQSATVTHPVAIRRMVLPKGRRVLAAGDIHGEGELLLRALEKARFCEDDTLVLVGDYLRHGGDSLKTLRTVMELCKTHTVIPLCGNNDLYILDCIENPEKQWEEAFVSELARPGYSVPREMAQELGLDPNACREPGELRRILQNAFQKELQFIRELPTILETERFTFVHGGLPVPELEALEGTDAYSCMKIDSYMDLGLKLSKYTVVGHWPATLYRDKQPCQNPLVNDALRLVSIDGGCSIKRDGQVNVLILPEQFEDGNFPLDFVFCDNLPHCQVLESQKASPGCFYINWTDRFVDLLEREGDSCLVRHLSTGRTMRVPAGLLWEEEGKLCCGDTTDFCLGVAQGDVVSLVFSSEQGTLIKKDGYSGWYRPGPSKLKAL